MTDQDPFCPLNHALFTEPCELCRGLGMARSSERERIADDVRDFVRRAYPDGPRSRDPMLLQKWLAVSEVADLIEGT